MITADRPLRGALVGCGNVARHHLAAWARVEGARLVALCERDPERLADARRACPGLPGYADFEHLLDDHIPDFVEICTGPEAHLSLVGRAARRGIHVLCQKPVTTTRDDLVEMLHICDESRVALMVHENWRFRPWNRALRDAVQVGRIGRPIRLRLAHRDTRALRPDGFFEQPFLSTRPELIVLEMGCHLVDLARFVMGEVEAVHATLGRYGQGHPGEDVAMLTLMFVGGAIGSLDMSWCAPANPAFSRAEWALNETAVEGTEGSIVINRDGALLFSDLAGRSWVEPVELPPHEDVYVDAYRATQQHFIDGLRGGTAHQTGGQGTLRTMDVVWAAYRSAAEGRNVAL